MKRVDALPPAVLAELPEVRALVAAALQRAANQIRLSAPGAWFVRDVDRVQDAILALIDTDHAAALEAVKAQAREEAAQIADAYAQDPNCIMDRGDFWAAQIAADIRAGKVQP